MSHHSSGRTDSEFSTKAVSGLHYWPVCVIVYRCVVQSVCGGQRTTLGISSCFVFYFKTESPCCLLMDTLDWPGSLLFHLSLCYRSIGIELQVWAAACAFLYVDYEDSNSNLFSVLPGEQSFPTLNISHYYLSILSQPELENIPDTPKEARMKTCWKRMKNETEEGQEFCPQVIIPLEMVPVPEEQMPALSEPPVLYEEVSTTVVTTTASEAVLASWSRIAANANKNEALQSITTPENYGKSNIRISHNHQRFLSHTHPSYYFLSSIQGRAWELVFLGIVELGSKKYNPGWLLFGLAFHMPRWLVLFTIRLHPRVRISNICPNNREADDPGSHTDSYFFKWLAHQAGSSVLWCHFFSFL